MADEAVLIDDIAGRARAFFTAMGIAEWFYMPAVQASIAHALAAPMDATSQPWAPFGGRNIGGRIRALAQDPRSPLVMYAGTAMGGVFRTTNGGDTWSHLGRPQDAFSVGALAVDAVNSNVIYVGTGEPTCPANITAPPPPAQVVIDNTWAAAGVGFLSCDTSAASPAFTTEAPSWSGTVATAQATAAAAGQPIPPFATVAIPPGAADRYMRIVCDPATPGRCWIASQTGLWRREPGPPMTIVREPVPVPTPTVANPNNAPQGAVVTDVVLSDNPAQAGTYRLFAAVATFGVFRGVYNPAAGGNVVWDGAPLGGGLPAASTVAGLTHDRIRLAVCGSAPDHVYALVENGQLPIGTPDPRAVLDVFHSADGGNTWTGWVAGSNPPTSAPGALLGDGPAVGQGGQPWGHLVLEVHPDNPALVVAGGMNLALSRDFGANWERIIHWPNFGDGDRAQHGDQHAIVFDAVDPRRLWVGNDGGIAMAPDIVRVNPRTAGTWRKRSHGIFAAQFNEIAVNPSHPTMVGGGLQDNATYITYGGETWHVVSDADGGQMAFTINDPRTYIAPNQSNVLVSTVVPGTSVTPAPGFYPLVQRRRVNADLPSPHEFFAVNLAQTGFASLFIPIIAQHRSTAGHFIVGQNGQAIWTPDNGINFFNAFVGAIPPGLAGANVSAIAYGNRTGNATTEDWWVGTASGAVLLGANAPPAATAWTTVTPPGVKPRSLITRIAVHPASDDYVAVATATQDTAVSLASPFPFRGQVFLTLDRGQNWADITGLVAVGAPPPGVGPNALPPSPITSLVFDPQSAAGANQVLHAGTLAGVYVIRNLPALRIPAAVGAVPPFRPHWQVFNGPAGPGALPLTLVKDLQLSSIGADGAAPVGSLESVARHRLIAATYGRGMHICDITNYPAAVAPTGGPTRRLYIRQTLVEAGLSYPRPTPATLNAAPAAGAPNQYGGDPRLPTMPAPAYPIVFTDQDAFDIRIDNPPYQFLEDVIDGVEFDEDLRTKPMKPGEVNVVYVQVHSSGWAAGQPVRVHLFFAAAPGPGAPDLHGGFWGSYTQDPLPAPAAAPAAPAAPWQRGGRAATLSRVAANQPEVARFEWVPPVALAGGNVALLAVCTSADDALPAGLPEVVATLVRNERRVAVRVAPVLPYVADLFIRDGLDDDGSLGGVAYGGRSPDIIVVEAAVADPAQAFRDLGDARELDRVRGNGGDNVVYVRVHNRRDVETSADVELLWALPNAPVSTAPGQAGPPFDVSKWQVIAPIDAVNINVPARGTRLARFDFSAAPAPETNFPNAVAFIALIRSHDGSDPTPQRTNVDTQEEFWRLFTQLANANNAALRAVRYA